MPGLTFVAAGDAFDAELAGVSVLYQGGRTLLVDCGPSAPQALWRITRDPSVLDGIYVSRPHADQGFGLPTLLAWLRRDGRTRPLDILGGPAIGPWMDRLLALGYPEFAASVPPFELRQVEVTPERFVDFGPVRIRVAPTRHAGESLAVRLEEATWTVCVSGSGSPGVGTRRLYDGASVLVHGLSSVELSELLDLQEERAVERLCIVELDRGRRDALRAAVGRNEGVVVPGPGDQIVLGTTRYRTEGEWI